MNRPRETIRLSDGTVIELGEGEILPEGATFTRPLLLRDSTSGSDPRSIDPAIRAEAERDVAYAMMREAIAAAWQGPGSMPLPQSNQGITAEDARAQMAREMSEAWENPSGFGRAR